MTAPVVLVHWSAWTVVVGVNVPVIVTVPVLEFITPAAVDAVILPVIVTGPVLTLFTPAVFVAVTFPVTVTDPIKLFVMPIPFVDVPVPAVTFPVTIAVAAPDDTFKLKQWLFAPLVPQFKLPVILQTPLPDRFIAYAPTPDTDVPDV
jgi:hypothetical protein